MLIPKNNRRRIYEVLFRDGTLVAKKDFNASSSIELPDIPNLHVIKACQSLTSKGCLKTRFSWQYYYYILTNEGIDYLREWLHLPNEVLPNTHKRQTRPQVSRVSRGGDNTYRSSKGDKYEYRRRDHGDKKEGITPRDFAPSFRGGIERM